MRFDKTIDGPDNTLIVRVAMKHKQDILIFSLSGLCILASFLVAYIPRQSTGTAASGILEPSFYEDVTHAESAESLRELDGLFQPLERPVLYRNRTKSACWIRFRLAPSPKDEDRFIEIDNASLEFIDVWFPDGTHERAGKYVNARENRVKTRIRNIPVPRGADSGEFVYARVRTNTIMFVPLAAVTARQALARSFRTNLVFGVFFGIIVAIIFINLFSFMVIRNRHFLVYLCYLVSLLVYHLVVHGFMYFLGLPPHFLESLLWLSLAGFGISMMVFAKRFLFLKERLPAVSTILDVNIGLFLVQTALGISMQVYLANQIAYITGFIVPIIIMATTVKLYVSGYREVRFYLIAWVALFTGTTIWSTSAYAEARISANYFFLVGTSVDSLLFTLAIFDLLRKELSEKDVMLEREKYYINLSRTDPLTGLYNRRYLNELIKRLESDGEIPSDSALIMIDLDNFKTINDTYGHLAGDLILTKTGTKIKKHIRKTDIACRYGGDEFLVFLPGANESAARLIAESIRNDIVADCSYSEEGSPISITVSIGISENRLDDSFDGLFLRADAALYQAKKTGRDRISVL